MQRVQRVVKIAQPNIGIEEKKAVFDVLKNGYLSQGERVKEFENKFAGYIRTKYAIAVSSGTDALFLSLLSFGIKEGDEVITTPFSFFASASAISRVGAKPVFVDIDDSFNIDPHKIQEKITEKTRALLIVHLYGNPCDMDSIKKIAKSNNIPIIEDACQAHGATYRNKKVGSLGDVGCFSFYPTKNMTTGEGGIIVCNSKKISDKVCLLRNHGMKKRYYHSIFGFNMRMTNIEAAIGIEQLRKLEYSNEKRRKNAALFTKLLVGVRGIVLPKVNENSQHIFHQYTIRITPQYSISRDLLRKKLLEQGIETEIYYPVPIHKQEVYKEMSLKLPVAETFSQQVLSLPVHPLVKISDIKRICSIISSFQ